MGYPREISEAALAEMERRRKSAEAAARENTERFYRQCPEAREIKSELAANAAGAARAVVGGGDVRAKLEELKERSARLNARYDELLNGAGLRREDVSPRYRCTQCGDTGFVDGRMCACLKQLRRSLAYERLSGSVPLDKCRFDNFSLDYYKGDERAARQMENILRVCRTYAENLRPNSPSFLFRGGTGLGKTHLSLAIAGAAVEKGFGVVYGSAYRFAAALEKERFVRETDEADSTHDRLTDCDLLIIDDLGAEPPSAYVAAALYDVINTRMLAEMPTIISTNLSTKELEGRYGERFASRVAGYYGKLEFLGSDVRIEMQRRRAQRQEP